MVKSVAKVSANHPRVNAMRGTVVVLFGFLDGHAAGAMVIGSHAQRIMPTAKGNLNGCYFLARMM
jgi:hypothetical protein